MIDRCTSCATLVASIAAVAPCAPLRAQLPAGHIVTAHLGTSSSWGPGGLLIHHPRNATTPIAIRGLPPELVGPIGAATFGCNRIAILPDGSLVVGMYGSADGRSIPIDLYHLDVIDDMAFVRRRVTLGTLPNLHVGAVLDLEVVGPNLVAVLAGDFTSNTPLGPPGGLGGAWIGVYDASTGVAAPITITNPPVARPAAIAARGGSLFFALGQQPSTSISIYRVPVAGGAATPCVTVAQNVSTDLVFDCAGNLRAGGVEIDPATCAAIVAPCNHPSATTFDCASNTVVLNSAMDLRWTDARCVVVHELWSLVPGGGGLLAHHAVVPNPLAHGTSSPVGGPGYHWIVPPGAGAPLLGNMGFALAVVDATGAQPGIGGAFVLGLDPLAPPASVLGVDLRVDPASWVAIDMLSSSGMVALPIPAASTLVGMTFWLQSLHWNGSAAASSDTVSLTVL